MIEEKNQIILNQNRARFGQRSEKRSYVLTDGQMSMFEITGDGLTEQQEESKSEAAEATISIPAHTRKPKRKLEELCAGLPVEEVVCDLPENERFNAQGEPLRQIGKEYVRTELCREKAKVWVKKYYSVTYADPRAERETGYADIRKAPTPAPLLQHSYVGFRCRGCHDSEVSRRHAVVPSGAGVETRTQRTSQAGNHGKLDGADSRHLPEAVLEHVP